MRECNWDLNHLVGKHEYHARQIRFQSGFLVVVSENPVFPRKQIGIAPGEFIPVDGREARHPLPDQEEVSMSNRLVVALRLAPRGGIASKGSGKFLKRFERRVLRKIRERQSHMVGVMKRLSRNHVGFESDNEFLIAQLRLEGDIVLLSMWGQPPSAVRRAQLGSF